MPVLGIFLMCCAPIIGVLELRACERPYKMLACFAIGLIIVMATVEQ